MTTFYCKHCHFKYKPRGQRKQPPERCPNCGEKETMVFTPTAEDIIRESQILLV